MAYLLVLPAILGAYIFFFRFLSIHSYEQKHFYVVYFMEIMLVWFAVNNVITVYIPDKEHLNFVYSVACAIALGLLMVKFEQFALEKFVLEGL